MPCDVPPLPLLTIRPGRMVLRRAGADGAGGAPETLAEFPYAEGAEDAALGAVAAALGPGAGPVALGLPESVVRVLVLGAHGPGRAMQRRQIAAALEGVTPYPVAELVFDWRADPGPDAPMGQVRVAVVARETLAEAAAALGAHGLSLGAAQAEGLAGFEGPARFDLSGLGLGAAAEAEPYLPPVVRATPAAPAEALERIVGRLAILRAPARSGRRALGIALTTAAVVGGLALFALAGRGGGHAEAERAALSAVAPRAAEAPASAQVADRRLAQAVTGAAGGAAGAETPAAGATRSDAGAPLAGAGARDPTFSRIGAVAVAAQPRLMALTPPAIAALTRADPPMRGLPPPPPGVVYTLDPEGAVMPTAEGVLLADGVRLFAGAPPVVPPLPPGRVAAPAPTPDPAGAAPAADQAAAAAIPPPQATPAPTPAPAAPPQAAEAVAAAEAASSQPARMTGPVALPPQPPAVRAALRAAEARRNVIVPPLPPRVAQQAPAAEPAAAPPAAAPPEAAPVAPAPPPATEAAPAAPAVAETPAPRPLAFAPPPRPFAPAPAPAPETAPAAPQRPLAFAPPARPVGLAPPPAPAAAAEAGTRTAVAAPPPRPAGLKAPTRRADPGAPAVVSSGEEVRTPSGTERIVAREATSRGLDMGQVNLIGVFGTQQNRTALIREVDGRIRRVKVGDRIEGGRVAAIGSDELRYVRDGQNLTLRMPRN